MQQTHIFLKLILEVPFNSILEQKHLAKVHVLSVVHEYRFQNNLYI